MLKHLERTLAVARNPVRANGAIARALSRFRRELQPKVRALAAHHPFVADLALSFPALLFALAHPRAGADAKTGLRLASAGAPLARIAAAMDVPMWMRAFPPEAFARPLPTLPDNPEFRLRIANHLPARWSLAPRWIETVANAARWGDEAIALWFAREILDRKSAGYESDAPDRHRLLCLWAWFSVRARNHAGSLIAARWRPAMHWSAALSAALAWRETVALHLYLDREAGHAWMEEGELQGYSFVALRSAEAIEAEAQAMQHCVRAYGDRIALNTHCVFSVRKDGVRRATLAVGRTAGHCPFPRIVDLRGKHNAEPEPEIWRAARGWLTAQDADPFEGDRFCYGRPTFDARAWRRLWRPYWMAMRRIPDWLPLAPSREALEKL